MIVPVIDVIQQQPTLMILMHKQVFVQVDLVVLMMLLEPANAVVFMQIELQHHNVKPHRLLVFILLMASALMMVVVVCPV